MTLIYIDGCEDNTANGTGATDGSTANGRNGKGRTSVTYAIPAAQQSDYVTMGAAIRVGATTQVLFNLTGAGTVGIEVRVTSTGVLSVTRVGSSLSLVSAAGVIPANTWVYLEVQVRIHDTLGTVTVQLNGANVAACTGTGLDTKASTGTVVDSVALNVTGTGSIGLDDVYLMTGSGDSFLGDVRVDTLYPDGNGASSAWVGSDGNSTDNYLLVDETPVSASDYTGSPTSAAKDLYTFQNLSGTGVIYGVMHAATMVKSDAGAVQAKVVNHSGTGDTKSAAFTPGTTASTFYLCLPTNPDTSLAWTEAEVNALQAGVEVV